MEGQRESPPPLFFYIFRLSPFLSSLLYLPFSFSLLSFPLQPFFIFHLRLREAQKQMVLHFLFKASFQILVPTLVLAPFDLVALSRPHFNLKDVSVFHGRAL